MTKEQILARQQEILALAKNEHRDLNDAEKAEFDGLQKSLEALGNTSPAPQPDQAEVAQRAIEAERARVADITALCRDFEVDSAEYIRSGKTIDEVRAAVLESVKQTRKPVSVSVGEEGEDRFRRDMEDAIVLKAGLGVQKASAEANKMRSMSLRAMAEECLVREGMTDGEVRHMTSDQILEAVSGTRMYFNPGAAFPAIMDNAVKKSIVEQYNKVPTSFEKWTSKGSLSDFKDTKDHEYVLGGFGDFLKVPENGELKADKPRTELLPTRKLETYGRQFSMTREAFINDDISFLTAIPGGYAKAAKRTIDKQVYSLLVAANTKFADGVNLFHANHKNLMTTGSKPTQQVLQDMILQMQKQTDQFGDAIYMTPKYLIVPVGYKFDLDVILHTAQVVGSANNDKNPMYNAPFEIVETPVLNALAGTGAIPWFMVSDEASAKSIQVDYLNGVETPTTRRMETPGKLGFVWDMWLDWGICIKDFRSMVKNPGVAL